jgi:hypothetical protein
MTTEKSPEGGALPLNEDTDARRWAREFIETIGGPVVNGDEDGPDIDEDFMHGWFANAIMCGVDSQTRKGTLELRPIVSRNLSAIAYLPQCRVLLVQFKGGAVYQYEGVPEVVYEKFMEATSKGRFFQEHVRDAGFPTRKIPIDLAVMPSEAPAWPFPTLENSGSD